jgi:hypothetical protein
MNLLMILLNPNNMGNHYHYFFVELLLAIRGGIDGGNVGQFSAS